MSHTHSIRHKTMSKQKLDFNLDDVRQVLRSFSEPVSISDISAALGDGINRRTLQRRLSLLIEGKELSVTGKNRWARYAFTPVVDAAHSEDARIGQNTEVYVPTSKAGDMIRKSVCRPVQGRTPVGYNRDFLSAYQPNQTFYLPEKTRRYLAEIGQSHVMGAPAGTYALSIYQRLLIDLSWNSSRLEGNTYSLLETECLLEVGDIAAGKNVLETQMILNHKNAIELLVRSESEIDFNHYTICNLHALLSENLLPDPGACGRLREHAIGIGRSVFIPLQEGPLIKLFFDEVLKKASQIKDPFEKAFFAMVHLPYLQPFDDVNKRVSRLAANISLIKENLSPLSFVDVPDKAYIDGLQGVYELNKTELFCDVFVWAYERSCARYAAVRQSLGEPDPFRLRYREHIVKIVTDIVLGCLGKIEAVAVIKAYAGKEITSTDRGRFSEVVETELMNLREGNIARYRVRPSQFSEWEKNWS